MKPKLLPILAIYALGFGFGLTITVLAPAMDAITSDFGITMAEGGLTNTLFQYLKRDEPVNEEQFIGIISEFIAKA